MLTMTGGAEPQRKKLSRSMMIALRDIAEKANGGTSVDGYVDASAATKSALVRRGLIIWEDGESMHGKVTLTDAGIAFLARQAEAA